MPWPLPFRVMPMPVSTIEIWMPSPPLRATPIVTRALRRRELDGVGQQVEQDLAHRARVGVQDRAVVGDVGAQLHAAVGGHLAD